MMYIGVSFLAALLLNAIVVGTDVRPAEPRQGGELIETSVATANVRVDGHGSPIVLIHGFGAALDYWDLMVPTLARNHEVIRVDLIGHGGTEAPRRGYEIPTQAQMVYEVLQQLHVSRTVVIGHSMGGEVAVALTEAHPELVSHLVLIDTPATSGVSFDRSFKIADTPVIGQAAFELAGERIDRKLVAEAFAPGFDFPESFVDDLRQLTYSSSTQAHAKSEAYRTAIPVNQRITQLAHRPPVLVIMGALDDVVTGGQVELFRSSGIPVEIIPGVGHSPIVEAPQQTLALILGFI
jgi:pimeloyl-ACP methyl ester carboxylesterase